MKALQRSSFLVLALSVALWAAGRIFFPLPDWTVRLNGGIMMVAMALLAFASARLHVRREG